MGLVLAFDTATHVATVALVDGGQPLAERTTRPFRVLADADELLAGLGATQDDITALVGRHRPGQLHGHEARARARARLRPGACTCPSPACRRWTRWRPAQHGALPVIDAGRREVFTKVDGEPRALPAAELDVEGVTCVGDGALRYRTTLEERGAHVPPDASPQHVPHARLHVALAADFGSAELAGADLRATAGREGACVSAILQIRPLGVGDLDAVGEIERSSMPAPWSPAMFAGEIAKPTSVCLGAWESPTPITWSATSSCRGTSTRGT